MDVALRTVVPVGLVRWRGQPTSYSVVVKVTFDANDGSRPATVARDQLALSTGELDGRGVILEPSDFARVKNVCDVVLADSTLSSARPVRVRVGHIDGNIAPPMPMASPDGCCAPPEQRLAIPSLPLTVVLDYPGARAIAVIPAPPPAAAILPRGKPRAMPILLKPDTVLVHPWQPRVTVVYRGSFQHTGDVDEDLVLIVDVGGPISATPSRDIQRWPVQTAVQPTEYDPVPIDALDAPAQEAPLARSNTMEMEAIPEDAPGALAQEDEVAELTPQPTLDMEIPLDDPIPQTTLTMAAVDGSLPPSYTVEMPIVGAPPPAPAGPLAPTFGPPPVHAAPVADAGPHARDVPAAPTFGPHPLATPPSLSTGEIGAIGAPPAPLPFAPPAPQPFAPQRETLADEATPDANAPNPPRR